MSFFLGAVAAAAAVAQAGPAPAPCRATLCYPENIAPFLARLREGGRSDARLHILQIGDSHTAGDMITNGWRVPLQQRHGAGGRGVLAAGRPYGGYLTWGVTASQSGGWRVNAGFGGRFDANGAPLGLSGFTQTTAGAGETLGVSADTPDFNFDRLVVCAIREPGAGSVTLRLGAREEQWALATPRREPACRTLESETPVAAASLTTQGGGTVSITSMGTFRRGGGAALSNVGVVGAQLIHLGRAQESVIRAELAAYRPDLIVLAFGTNEGFSPTNNAEFFEAALRNQIGRIRRLAGPSAPILLLGAPDAATQNRGLRPETDCGDGWGPPRLLGEVRQIQIRLARELGLAFWNWAGAMGGACAAHQWRLQGLMRGDHVHFTREGGDRIGRALNADLERAAASLPDAPPPSRRRP